MKRTRVNPMSARRRAANAELAEAREQVEARARGMCELGTPACPTSDHRGNQAHHLKPRSAGVDHSPSNLAWTCDLGHRYAHAHPAESYEKGWLLHSWDNPTKDEADA